MDLKLVREEAIAETTRFFWDNRGFVPSEDSDEWEAEYRRQFELSEDAPREWRGRDCRLQPRPAGNTRHRAKQPGKADGGADADPLGRLVARRSAARDPRSRGARVARHDLDQSPELDRHPGTCRPPVFLQRITPHYQEYRKKTDEEARIRAQQRQAQQAAADAIRKEVEAAGITIEGLIELIDVCDRLPSVPLKTKLAELDHDGRTLRIFETDDPALLMVLEKDKTGRAEYAIERDEGLVGDLVLLMRAQTLSEQ